MSAQALFDVRDRLVTRVADFDHKMLTLLFGITAAWGVSKATSLPAGPMVAVFLALAGLLASLGWSFQRRLLWWMDDSYAGAIAAAGAEGGDTAHPLAGTGGARLHYGERSPLAGIVVRGVSAIWS